MIMTTMNNGIFFGILCGLALGAFYFAGLWLTVLVLPRVKHAGQFLLFSFILRIMPVLAVLWLLLDRRPIMFFVALPAFFVVRLIMTKKIGPACREVCHGNQS